MLLERRRLRPDGLVVGHGVTGGRVARRERVGDLLVVRPVLEVDAEGAERVDEHLLCLCERDAILRSARACERRLDVVEIELDHL